MGPCSHRVMEAVVGEVVMKVVMEPAESHSGAPLRCWIRVGSQKLGPYPDGTAVRAVIEQAERRRQEAALGIGGG